MVDTALTPANNVGAAEPAKAAAAEKKENNVGLVFSALVLTTLSEREAGVVRLRFGLTDGMPRTLDEIGQVYGVTRERIRVLERENAKLREEREILRKAAKYFAEETNW